MTIADVARQARVAPMTVSRYLRAPATVAADTGERVAQAVADLGYVPNLSAGTLASGRSRIVATIVPSLNSAFFADTVQGMADHLRTHGYQLLLGNSGYSLAEEESLVHAFLGRQADAIVLTGVEHNASLRRALRGASVPVVETWDLTDSPIDMVVGFSNREAAQRMTLALAERSYRHIGYVGVEQGEQRGVQRLTGYRAATRVLGYARDLVRAVPHDASYRGGGEELAQLLEAHPEVDAVLFGNDVFAIHALMTCRRRGWEVPGRVAIAGFGGLDLAADLAPSLSTVRVPGYAIGERAAHMVLARLAGAEVSESRVDLGFELVFRESA